MLTIFAIPRAFKGHIGIIQRNAIRSWTLLRPEPEIILFGDDEGTAEAANGYGVRHVAEVARNEYGTPLFNDLFEKAQRLATFDLLCYVNADIILMSDFMWAVHQIQSWRKQFLMVGKRRDVDIVEPWDFERPGWEEKLRAVPEAWRQIIASSDYFVFPRGFYNDIPPFAIGRGTHDGWLFWKARALHAPVVDATRAVMALHQNHDYSHVHGTKPGAIWPWQAEEGQRNAHLVDGTRLWFLREATHALTPTRITRVWGRKFPLLARDFLVYRVGPIVQKAGLRRSYLRSIKDAVASAIVRPKG